jgi:hypothetical protein
MRTAQSSRAPDAEPREGSESELPARARGRLRRTIARIPRPAVRYGGGDSPRTVPRDADVLGELDAAIDELLAERARLLHDRRTSLRAKAWALHGRAALWREARLGVLWQHPPRPLRVPAHYLTTEPPTPAPSISIVTPSLDQGEFIGRTISSVLSQGYPSLEYVVQDGGSRDATLDVLRAREGQLTRWSSEPDDGQADAINRGFAHTSGEIMAYLNSDDVLLPGALAAVGRYFAEHGEVDAVYGHRILIDAHDRQVGSWVMPRHDDEMLRWSDSVPQETLFWRRRIWERAGGAMDPSFRFAIDWDLLLRFVDAGARIVRLDRYLGAFRVHAAQKTTVQARLGEQESDRLRERCHGRSIPWPEAYEHLQPYLRAHVRAHTLHRAMDRLPRRRVRLTFGSP